jgi:hypothetical protein
VGTQRIAAVGREDVTRRVDAIRDLYEFGAASM